MSTQELRSGVEHRSIGAEGCAAERRGGSEPQRIAQRSIGASERRVAQRSEVHGASEHRSGRAAALDGVEHRSRGLRSGAERSIGAEGCAAERSGASEHRSIGAEELPHYGVEQIRGRIGASECRISAVDRSGAEWSIGTSERRVAAPEHHQAELIQLHEYKSTCGLVQAPERSNGASEQERLPGHALHSLCPNNLHQSHTSCRENGTTPNADQAILQGELVSKTQLPQKDKT